MLKRVVMAGLGCLLVMVLVSPAPVAAQAGPEAVKSSADVQFPLQIKFNLAARSSARVVDVRLRYSVEQTSFVRVVSEAFVPLTPAASVDLSWTLDMRRTGGLPPGAVVRYWWVIRDAAGGRIETAPVSIRFNDGRRTWQELTSGLVSIFWYNGGKSFADQLMASAQGALDKLKKDTGAVIEKPLRFYIYANQQDLLGAMIFPQEWTGAVTYSEFGTIVMGLSQAEMNWGTRVIAHELAHAVTHQITANPYSDLPRWLDEGLATYNEGLLDVAFSTALHAAVAADKLISVRSLASPFSARSDLASLSYAESFSIVDYLISTYGQDKMLELLGVFSRGSTYDSALTAVYGFDTDGLNTRWREHVTKLFQPNRQTVGLLPETR